MNCERELHGRSDQKFCSDQCRNTYNNSLNADNNNFNSKSKLYTSEKTEGYLKN